jgi:hypothetical protein
MRSTIRPVVRVLNYIFCATLALSFFWLLAIESGPIPVIIVAILAVLALPLSWLSYWLGISN